MSHNKSRLAQSTLTIVAAQSFAIVATWLASFGLGPTAAMAATPEAAASIPYTDSVGTIARLTDENSYPFRILGIEVLTASAAVISPENQRKYQSSIERYRSVRDCLSESERVRPQPDLTKFDWDEIHRNEDAEVCIFRVATSYSAPVDLENWFESQGFVVEVFEAPGGEVSGISANWSIGRQGVRFSSNIFERTWISLVADSLGVSINYGSDDAITSVGVSLTIL
jgi:hypothetical protein